jgi:hypothetical protein
MIIFLSYRRDDAGGWARKLADALCQRFHRKNVFIDVDRIKNFQDFENAIFTSIDRCDVFLAVIGPHWLKLRDAQTGQRRLDRPDDYVRLEIGRALQSKISVLPVLVDNAVLPAPEELPEELRDLLRPRFQALSPDRWNEDLADLLQKVDTRYSLWSRRGVIATMVAFASGALVGLLGARGTHWVSSQLGIDNKSLEDGYYWSGYNYYDAYGYQGVVGGHLL